MTLPKVWKFDSELLRVRDLTEDTKNFTFTIPSDFHFTPGQFITAVLRDEEGKQLRRSYSIASPPSVKGELDLCIKKIENGKGTDIFWNLEQGNEVHFMGPLGHFIVKDEQEDMIFIGTGTGISPYRSIIPNMLSKGFNNQIMLLCGFRHHVLYEEEWNELSDQYEQFTFKPILSQPHEDHYIEKGRVTDLIDEYIPKDFTGRFYLCGLNAMIQEVAGKLASKGVTKERIVFERYD